MKIERFGEHIVHFWEVPYDTLAPPPLLAYGGEGEHALPPIDTLVTPSGYTTA